MRKSFLAFLGAILMATSVFADEGMWMLKELNRQSAARMKELGFTFPTDSIYNENNPSLKDAVIIFGGGCTGVAVSQQGLIFTNHHCGYGDIQKLSSVQHDYLKDGFVSQRLQDELPCEGLQVRFLQKTEDVTARVLANVTEADSEAVRSQKAKEATTEILKEYAGNKFLEARVVPFYTRNKYYLVVYKVFHDVRLVLTPPSSVGKFGGETDNWMYPRHTGDFAVFRVYADANNNPAEYSTSNRPYRPQYTVPISLKGYKDKDYAMTIGYPGRTDRYLSSWGVTRLIESENKPRIEVRTAKQDIWKKAMLASDAVRIKYASKYARSSNYWKNSIGMNTALERLKVINDKRALEAQFADFLKRDASARAKYGEALTLLESGMTASGDLQKVRTYFTETFPGGIEIVTWGNIWNSVAKGELSYEKAMERTAGYLKDYELPLDRELTPALLKLYADRVPAKYLPDVYTTIQKKFKGDYNKYAQWLFANSVVTDAAKIEKLMKKGGAKALEKDPALVLARSVKAMQQTIQGEMEKYDEQIDRGNRLFMAGLMAMNPEKAYSPDANFTQRLSYGSVGGYSPKDGVEYNYQTTSDGVLDKVKQDDPEFMLQQYIVNDLQSKDFGQYAENGKLYVNFLSNNDITGGNSGSPVFNGNAELIGLAFDGNWEALSGDIVFEKNMQRTISVDIRYVMYVIDKVMKCPRLVQEVQFRK